LYQEASGVAPGVFAVLEGGQFEINDGNPGGFSARNDVCKVNFKGSSTINVGLSGYYPPKKSDCGLTASDTTVDKLPLPTFQRLWTSRDIRIKNSAPEVTVTIESTNQPMPTRYTQVKTHFVKIATRTIVMPAIWV
jgi:hypothetical protein